MEEVNPRVVEIIDSMDFQELKAIILEAADYGEMLIRGCAYIIKREPLFRGDDLAMKAIERVLDGQRKWNPYNEPDLSRYLKSVVKSLFYHEVITRVKKEYVIVDSENLNKQDLINCLPSKVLNPAQELENKEFKERILDYFEREEDQLVLLCLLEGISKLSDIAEELKFDAKEVSRIKRNIERRLFKIENKGVSK